MEFKNISLNTTNNIYKEINKICKPIVITIKGETELAYEEILLNCGNNLIKMTRSCGLYKKCDLILEQ